MLDQPCPSLRDGLKIFAHDPLISVPGTKFTYSSYNWNVLGVIMETVTHQPYLDYMQANVLQPLSLTNTGPDLAGVTDPRRTQFYETDAAGNFIVAPPVDCSYKWPSGGFLSTAGDIARFGSAMSRPGFLQTNTLQILFTSQTALTATNSRPTHYGIGWFVGRTILYHGGDSIGGTSMLLLLPARHTVVAILCNRGHLTFSGTPAHPVITPKTDLNLAPTPNKSPKPSPPWTPSPDPHSPQKNALPQSYCT